LLSTSTTSYSITILSAILGLFAFKDHPTTSIDKVPFLTLCAAGIAISIPWFFTVRYFRNLFRSKLDVLTLMESRLPYQTFHTRT